MTFALRLFCLSGRASDKMKGKIKINETLHVGSTQIAPGEYNTTWTESGSNSEATFSQGKKVIATVPAQVTQERSEYPEPALRIDGVSDTLVGVLLPGLSLSFNEKNARSANRGN